MTYRLVRLRTSIRNFNSRVSLNRAQHIGRRRAMTQPAQRDAHSSNAARVVSRDASGPPRQLQAWHQNLYQGRVTR